MDTASLIWPLLLLAVSASADELPAVQIQERDDWREACAIGIVPVPFAEGCVVIARAPTRCQIFIKPKPSREALRLALEICERKAKPS